MHETTRWQITALAVAFAFAGVACSGAPGADVTGSDVASATSTTTVHPASDAWIDATEGVDATGATVTTNLHALVDEPAPNDATDYLRSAWNAPLAHYTAGYANGPSGKVTHVAVAVRAALGATTSCSSCTMTVELLDATNAASPVVVGTGSAHALGAAWATFTDAWSTSVASADALRTRITLANPLGGGALRVTAIAMSVTTSTVDTTPPTVVLTSPAGGASFTSAQTVSVTANASDDVGVTKVEIYDGARLVATDTAPPYAYAWNVDASQNGSHTWTAKAYDAAGHVTTSAPATVTVAVSSLPYLPSNMDGRVHRASSFHYYPGARITDATTAQAFARAFDVINVQPGSGGTSSQLGTFADDMIAAKPDLLLMTYGKSVQSTKPDGTYPPRYYAHKADGSEIFFGTFGVYIMQADGTGSYADPRGFTSQSWRDWRGRDAWWLIDDLDASQSGSPFQAAYLDSMGSFSYIGPPVDPSTGTAYTLTQWLALTYSVGDATKQHGGGRQVWGNGLGRGTAYFASSNPTSAMLGHVDGGLAESWLRDNGASATAFRSTAQWEADVDMVIDAGLRAKYVWVVVNVYNTTAGVGTDPGFTAQDLDRWHSYASATYLIANRGTAYMEFVPDVKVMPWNETHPTYGAALGAPLDTFDHASAYANGCVFRRRYASGAAFVNATTSSCTFTPDRAYTRLDGSPLGTSVTLGPNSGLVVTR